MTAPQPTLVIDVNVDSPANLHDRLNAAVDAAREEAIKHGRHGILVTQHGYSSFTVAVSPEVPFGLTAEKREW